MEKHKQTEKVFSCPYHTKYFLAASQIEQQLLQPNINFSKKKKKLKQKVSSILVKQGENEQGQWKIKFLNNNF